MPGLLRCSALIVILLSTISSGVRAQVPENHLQVSEKAITINGTTFGYIARYPEGYNLDNRYPVVLALSGGDASRSIVDYCYGAIFKSRLFNNHIIILPVTGPEKSLPLLTEQEVAALVDAIQAAEPVADNGWIALGTSNGGVAAFTIANQFPELFEGIIVAPGLTQLQEYPEEWRDYKIVMGGGEFDDEAWKNGTQITASRLENAGIAVVTATMEGEGHIATPEYDMDNIFRLYFDEQPPDQTNARRGVYDTTVAVAAAPFNGAQRSFSLFVPHDYDPVRSYPLIVGLHGFGMTGNGFRNTLKVAASNASAIIICPDGAGNRHDDEYNGNEIEIAEQAVEFARQGYNINTERVYLTGFSWGAREVLSYGMDAYARFRGLIPFSPAVQGLDDANNLIGLYRPFTYTNGRFIPTCLCMGGQDTSFYAAVQELRINQANADALLEYVEFPNVEHTYLHPRFDGTLLNCIEYIDGVVITSAPYATTANSSVRLAAHNGGLRIENGEGKEYAVRLYDITGRSVYAERGVRTDVALHGNVLPAGIYTYVLNDGNEVATGKLMAQ